eukprot:scaffold39008_cov17-Tisochrysis_lutea.AAC.2
MRTSYWLNACGPAIGSMHGTSYWLRLNGSLCNNLKLEGCSMCSFWSNPGVQQCAGSGWAQGQWLQALTSKGPPPAAGH